MYNIGLHQEWPIGDWTSLTPAALGEGLTEVGDSDLSMAIRRISREAGGLP